MEGLWGAYLHGLGHGARGEGAGEVEGGAAHTISHTHVRTAHTTTRGKPESGGLGLKGCSTLPRWMGERGLAGRGGEAGTYVWLGGIYLAYGWEVSVW